MSWLVIKMDETALLALNNEVAAMMECRFNDPTINKFNVALDANILRFTYMEVDDLNAA